MAKAPQAGTASRSEDQAERTGAFRQLRKLATPLRLRVSADAEGFPVILAKYGVIEWYHEEGKYLAAYTTARLIRGKLLVLPGVTRHQIGDQEIRVLFLAEMLPEVTRLLKARKRRAGHPRGTRNLLAGPRHSASASR